MKTSNHLKKYKKPNIEVLGNMKDLTKAGEGGPDWDDLSYYT